MQQVATATYNRRSDSYSSANPQSQPANLDTIENDIHDACVTLSS